jgi:PiT family inorganic phosphate transporter
MFHLLGGIFLGWSLGANNAANLFGTAVSSHMIRFWRAALLASLFVIVGSVLQGRHGIETLRGLSPLNLELAVLTSVAAAAAVTGMTLLRLPVSASQAVVGAIVGAGLLQHELHLHGLVKVAVCWLGTPVAGILFCLLIYPLLGGAYNRSPYNLFQMDQFTRIGLVVAGCYSAYALGSNNVANVTAVFVGAGLLEVSAATWIGGCSIAFGIMTFSRGVMETVGRNLVALDPYSSLVVVLSAAMAVYVYTLVGVPVSSSQAVIGAVLGIGVLKGTQTIRKKTLLSILVAWLVTPLAGCIFFFLFYFLSHLRYVP